MMTNGCDTTVAEICHGFRDWRTRRGADLEHPHLRNSILAWQ